MAHAVWRRSRRPIVSIEALGASLKRGGCRSAAGYLSIYRGYAERAGHSVDSALARALKDATRSCERGIGGTSGPWLSPSSASKRAPDEPKLMGSAAGGGGHSGGGLVPHEGDGVGLILSSLRDDGTLGPEAGSPLADLEGGWASPDRTGALALTSGGWLPLIHCM